MAGTNGHLNGESKGRGRPPKYTDKVPAQAYKLCLLGATDAELADFFEVAESTINEWKQSHEDFSESLKRGKAQADAEVSDKLHQRACGYEWDEAVPIKVKEVTYDKGKRVKETERVEMAMVHKVVPPDTTACIFWLKNRKPSAWRDKVEQEHSGAVDLQPLKLRFDTSLDEVV